MNDKANVSLRFVLVAIVTGLVLVGLAGEARAQTGDDLVGFANAVGTPLLIIVAVVGGGIAIFVKGVGEKGRAILGVAALVSVALLAATLGRAVEPLKDGDGTGGLGIKWSVLSDTTYPATADVTAEMLDSQGATACDGGTPDLNGVIATWGTNAFNDEQSKTFRFMSDSDDDVTRSAAGFQEIDCPTANWNIILSQPRDVNGDGTADSVAYFGRLVSIGPVTFNDGNLTTSNVLFYDPDFGWECGWFTEGAEWINAFGSGAQFQQPTQPTSGPWVPIGVNAGPGAASEDVVFACVFDATQGSPAGYTIPSSAGGEVWRAVVAIGSPEDAYTYTLSWVLQTRA